MKQVVYATSRATGMFITNITDGRRLQAMSIEAICDDGSFEKLGFLFTDVCFNLDSLTGLPLEIAMQVVTSIYLNKD